MRGPRSRIQHSVDAHFRVHKEQAGADDVQRSAFREAQPADTGAQVELADGALFFINMCARRSRRKKKAFAKFPRLSRQSFFFGFSFKHVRVA